MVDTASGNQREANGEAALCEGVRASVCIYKRASESASSPFEKPQIKGEINYYTATSAILIPDFRAGCELWVFHYNQS